MSNRVNLYETACLYCPLRRESSIRQGRIVRICEGWGNDHPQIYTRYVGYYCVCNQLKRIKKFSTPEWVKSWLKKMKRLLIIKKSRKESRLKCLHSLKNIMSATQRKPRIAFEKNADRSIFSATEIRVCNFLKIF